jgi:hypothetical protein
MRLRSRFRRKGLAPRQVIPASSAAADHDGPPLPDQRDDLQTAWAELTEAAKGSKVTRFHASTTTGLSWKPEAVFGLA